MMWLFVVGALALEPTSADALMPVYIARLELADARATEAAAKENLTGLRKRRSVVGQKMNTAKKLLTAAGEGAESDDARNRMEAAAKESAALEGDISAAEDALIVARAETHLSQAVRVHEVARSTLAHTDKPPEKIGGLQRAAERAAAKRAEATAVALSARATRE